MSENIWEAVLNSIKKTVSPQIFEMWFKNISLVSFEGNVMKLRVGSQFSKEWITKRYLPLITESINKVIGREPFLEFIVDEKTFPSSETPLPSEEPKQVLNLNPRYTFDNFVVGSSNRFAHAACLAVAESPVKVYNPLFIYGGVGLGKTHLLHAIGHFIFNTKHYIKILYTTAERFMNEMISGIQNKKIFEFRERYRNIDILLIDDIQFLAGKESTQEEFFHTFNTLHEAYKQIVITSDSSPKNIPTLQERLVSRFEWGLITDIQPPDFETRVAILKKKCEIANLSLPEEIIFFLAEKFTSSIRELEGALTKIIAFLNLNKEIKQSLNLEDVKEILKDVLPVGEKIITGELIQKVICEHYHISEEAIKAKKRTKELSLPRQVAMYLTRELTNLSLPEIGNLFGGREHATVVHAYNSISKKMKEDKKLLYTISTLKDKILKS
jgi:chromosomal replication initiator protein